MKKKNPSIPTPAAQKRVAQAEARALEAELRIEQAEIRVAQAEGRLERAKTRAEQAETRAERAESRTENAKTRTEHAEARTEKAETALEDCLHPDEKLKEEGAAQLLKQTSHLARLTARQLQILKSLAQGQNAKQIAYGLDLSPKTVEYHRAKLMKALALTDLAGLVRFAVRAGLITEDQ